MSKKNEQDIDENVTILDGKKIDLDELEELLDNLDYLRDKPFCCK
ncbi:MAG: hypothetical protein ACTSVI_10450 [Promethearchaeota archaeon]